MSIQSAETPTPLSNISNSVETPTSPTPDRLKPEMVIKEKARFLAGTKAGQELGGELALAGAVLAKQAEYHKKTA